MEQKDLMIGDLVLINRNTVKVCEILNFGKEDGFGKINAEWRKGEDCDDICEEGIYIDDLEPIPLTEEILENNWFGRSSSIDFHYAYKHRNSHLPMYVGIARPDEEKGFIFSFNIFGYFCHYVHELQHYLRIHGLDDIADDFKI